MAVDSLRSDGQGEREKERKRERSYLVIWTHMGDRLPVTQQRLEDITVDGMEELYTIAKVKELLYDFLLYTEAEYQQEVLDEGIVDPFPPGKRKCCRPQTPPEHLSSEEELTETMKAIKRGRLVRDSFGKRIRGPEI
ncbi:uncharacterized protein N7518_009269 [Penicillium psychrosexuale]|uniref:uncharacterized protein n=1 Tax=Penicillium psychrosexuale TaxID=1002107 RepID=UPI00254567CB|nr:uncharacterized protein N7518_009269 [Penicillium psychrosexuale]KAJ5783592.1 hypothetical protein N7518_009269 [Penicillium psychrosexuale]